MELNTVRHAVESFKHFIADRTGKQSSDFPYPSKLVYYILNMYRNAVSYQDRLQEDLYNTDESIILTLPCVELEEVDVLSECPCAPASGCYWFKSKYKIPRIIGGLPLSVTTIAPDCNNCDYDSREFNYVRWNDMQYKINSRIQAQRRAPYYTIRNIQSEYHIYIYDNSKYDNLQAVSLNAVPVDPIEFSSFPTCGSTPGVLCDPLDRQFVIDSELQVQVFELAFNYLQRAKASANGIDLLNNSIDDTSIQR